MASQLKTTLEEPPLCSVYVSLGSLSGLPIHTNAPTAATFGVTVLPFELCSIIDDPAVVSSPFQSTLKLENSQCLDPRTRE